MKYSKLGKKLSGKLLLWFSSAFVVGACGGATGGSSGSETNWLLQCASDSDCGALSCHCSVCTQSCETDDDCQNTKPGSVCALPNTARHQSVCSEGHDAGICVLPCKTDDDCSGSATCTAGACRPAANSKKPGGASCDSSDECASGVCEGEGCGAGQGVCAAVERACTADAVQYCGCDGDSFVSSGSCPGARYAHTGECEQPARSCDSTSDCPPDSICEGQGCGPAQGVCSPAERACTDDLVSYCGCDGETFMSSGSCPGARYEYRGACNEGPENCDSDADCPADSICEGEGCGPGEGVCAPSSRACTLDLVSYCGCDGETFTGSSSCPGGRFEHAGVCDM